MKIENMSKKILLFSCSFIYLTMSYGQIISDGTYQIFNSVHNEVITTDTSAPYEAFMAAQNGTDDFQLWTFSHKGGDIYKIVNVGSNTTLGINDGWCGQFGDVRAGFSNTDLNVEFKVSLSDTADNYVFEIAFTTCNFGSSNVPIKAFDIQDGNSGAQIQTFDVDISNPNQKFQILKPISASVQSGNWEDATTWHNGTLPSTDNQVIVNHNIVVNSDVVSSQVSITNNPTALLTISSGKSLIVNARLETSNQLILDSNSSSFSSLIVNGTMSGDISYNRFVSGNPLNDLIASPVSNLTFGDFSTSTSNIELFQNPANASEKLFGPFNNVSDVYEIYDEVINASTVLTAGKAYRAATNSGSKLTFQNSPNISDVAIAITDNSGNFGPWNLIGNPFPSYIDFNIFFSENLSELDTGSFQAIYGYDADNSDGSAWTIWNAFNTTDKIAPGQGFFVRTKSGGGMINFTTNMRTIGDSDDFIQGRSVTPPFIKTGFQLLTDNNIYTTKIYFAENLTRGLDPGYDAGVIFAEATHFSSYLIEDHQGQAFSLQALPFEDVNNSIVPLGVELNANMNGTIRLDALNTSIPSYIDIYLEDRLNNQWTHLNTVDYSFVPETDLSGIGRFYIHFNSDSLSIDEDYLEDLKIIVDQANKQVIIKGELNSNTKILVYDTLGKTILTQSVKPQKSDETIIDLSNLNSGVYILHLSNSNHNISKKIIVV